MTTYNPPSFTLTAQEKHQTLAEIQAHISRTATQLQSAKSPHDYADAMSLISHALTLAQDPEACDASMAPLATCYLYKGHVLAGLGRFLEAHEAYELAAETRTNDLFDAPVKSSARRKMMEVRGRAAVEKRGWVRIRRFNKRVGERERREEVKRAREMKRIKETGLEDGRRGKAMEILFEDTSLPVTFHPAPARIAGLVVAVVVPEQSERVVVEEHGHDDERILMSEDEYRAWWLQATRLVR